MSRRVRMWTRLFIAAPMALGGYVAWFIAADTGPGGLIIALPVSIGFVALMLHPRSLLIPQQGEMPILPGEAAEDSMILRPRAAWPATVVNATYAVALVWFTGYEGGLVDPDVLPGPLVAATATLMVLVHGATAALARPLMRTWAHGR